jgi:hypothetical protein
VGDADVADVLALLATFAASDVRARARPRHLAAPRARLRLPARPGDPAGPMLNGIVDVLAREADGAMLVVDYKTDRVADADLEVAVEAAYGTQRRIYALAALRAGAPAVEVVHLYLEPGRAVSARYVAADAPMLQAQLHEPAAGLLRGEFPGRGGSPRRPCAPPVRAGTGCARGRRA